MTPEVKKPMPAADQMKTVKAAWDKAPAGPEKDAGLKHCQLVEKAHTAQNDAEMTRHPDAAKHALA